MKLNGIVIPEPRTTDIVPFEISVKDRTASGRLVKDIKAFKRYINLPYLGLKPATIKVFKDVFYSGEAVPFEYNDSEGTQVVNVYINTLPESLLKANPTLSQNVTITLEEV